MAIERKETSNEAQQEKPDWIENLKNLRKNEVFFLVLALSATAVIWTIGNSLGTEGNESFLSDALKDTAKFWFSISIFDSAKEFFFRQDIAKDEEELLDKATTRFERIMDTNKNIFDNGIKRVLDSYDIIDLKKTILSLEDGDSLYCHDGSISDFSNLKEAIINKALAGVKFKFIALAPYCKNATRRAREVGKEIDFYSASCQDFAQSIEDIREEIRKRQDTQSGGSRRDNVQLKLYRSLMSIPFYLIETSDRPVTAITGFYLTKASSTSLHIVWEAPEGPRGKKAGGSQSENDLNSSNHFIKELWDYWKFKWDEGSKEYTQWKFLTGEWKYKSFDHQNKLVYEGDCTIKEEAKALRADGTRLKTISNGKTIDSRISWKTDVMHKYTEGDDLFIVMAHKCYPQSGDMAKKGVQAFISLKAITTQAGSESPDKMVGDFFVTAPPGLELFEIQTGRVEFTRHSAAEGQNGTEAEDSREKTEAT